MTRSVLILAAALLLCTGLRARTPGPEITFDHSEHTFGQIPEKGNPVSHVFPFVNTGDTPLIINSVETSCGCTTAKYDKKPVPPGGNSQIVITYNPKRQKGIFYKAIQVYSNEPQKRRIIVVQGEVLKGNR